MNTLTAANQQLFDAIQKQKVTGIRDAIRAGANINALDQFGFSALQVAAGQGNAEVLACLASFGANLRYVSPVDNMFPIAFAAAVGGLAALRSLAAHCADFESPIPHQKGALEHAIEASRPDVIDYLISHGADLEAHNERGETLLMRACAAGRLDIAMKLLDSGAKENSADHFGNSVLDYALSTGEITLIKRVAADVEDDEVRLHIHALQMQSRAKVDDTHVDDTPPLRITSRTVRRVGAWLRRRKFSKTTKQMWQKVSGSLARHQRQENLNFALIASLESLNVTTALNLIEMGADPNCKNADGVPVVILAAQAFKAHCKRLPDLPPSRVPGGLDYATIVLRLIMVGADPSARDPQTGRTILHEACANDHVVLAVTLLHERMIPHLVNVSDYDLNRPLHHAVCGRSYTTIDALAKAGADMNAVNQLGLAPLHVAALQVDPDSASLLVARGANTLLPTRSGRSLSACLDPKHSSYRTFIALIEARQAINSAMTIFSARNPLAAAARQLSRIPPKQKK